MPGLIAEKLGMSQIFNKNGVFTPVTVLRAGPCPVVQRKTKDSDDYNAIQLGFVEVDERRVNKARKGHCLKKNVKAQKVLREFRTEQAAQYNPGDLLTVNLFEEGDQIDVIAKSKGKGFQGVIKRHHFAGMLASHGCSISHRMPGSIGQRTYPGKVFKGKRMAGRMGGERVTMKGLTVVGIEAEQNLLLVKGSVPGANRSKVLVRACGNQFETRFLKSKSQQGTEATAQA